MRIVVCIKQVPDIGEVRFDPERKTLIREGVRNIVNPFDRRSVTQAVELVTRYGGEVIVVTMGPPQAEDALWECLAMGADRAVHLCDRVLAGSDTLVTARVLARAIRRVAPEFDLVFCGKYAVDAETGQVGPEVAELLGVPIVCGLTSVEDVKPGEYLRGYRETDEGRELVQVRLPALVTAAERLIRPMKVTEADVAAARSKPVERITAQELGFLPEEVGERGSPTAVVELRTEGATRQVQFLDPTDLDGAARRILALIERHLQTDGEEIIAVGGSRDRRNGAEIWVTVERALEGIRPVSFELLGEAGRLADRLGGQVCAVVFGQMKEEEARELSERGADHIYLLEHELLSETHPGAWGSALAEAIRRRSPLAVLCPSTAWGREYASRAAARLGVGLTGDCVGLEVDAEGRLLSLKPAFGGHIVAAIATRTHPVMATIRPGILALPGRHSGRRAPIHRLRLQEVVDSGIRVLERRIDVESRWGELERAPIVIGVGAGIGSPDALPPIEKLARSLGAALGASRKVVDLGWLPRQLQIGITGKSIAPRVYLALALRGNLNHAVGIRRAGCVIAINSDPQAEIFRAADYGLVADYREVLPRLLHLLEKE